MKHHATIMAEYLRYASMQGDVKFMGINEIREGEAKNPWAICTTSVGQDSPKYEDCVMDVKKKANHPMMGESGYAQWFATELKHRINENHSKDAVGPNGAADERTFSFTITTESDKMPQLLDCGQDCPYLEYQGNPNGEYRGTPWCNLFKKDLNYPRSYDGVNHPRRSSECISAVEGLM